MLKRLHIPLPCNFEDCSNMAYWRFNSSVMCHHHLCEMADMNSDNEEAVYLAIISPGIDDRIDKTILHLYPETILSALCAVLNTRPLDRLIEIVHHGSDENELVIGTGLFMVEVKYAGCNAPTISMVSESGEYDRVADRVNTYSVHMRTQIAREFDPGQEAGID
jgi:hypothetical protein